LNGAFSSLFPGWKKGGQYFSPDDPTGNKETLLGFGHPIRTKAAGANSDAAHGPVLHGMNPLQIGEPAAFRSVVGMAYVMPYLGFFATNRAHLGHNKPPEEK
jgi:hypothetical protein